MRGGGVIEHTINMIVNKRSSAGKLFVTLQTVPDFSVQMATVHILPGNVMAGMTAGTGVMN